MKPPCQFVAAHPRHHHVNDKQVEPRLGDDKSKRVRSIARGHDFVTTTPQRSFGEVPNPFIVIYDQNAAQGFCHAGYFIGARNGREWG
jgi:hypothetical protein